MNLHENEVLFRTRVLTATNELRLAASVIEKDYYVSLVLQRLKEKIPGILFKGGTCLSKCQNAIRRFSEDIDLTLDCSHFTQGQKRAANKAVLSVCDELRFPIVNREQVEKHGHGNYNCYLVKYPMLFPPTGITPYLKIEMVFIQKAYPDTVGDVGSILGEWMLKNGEKDFCAQFGLLPFPIRVQSLERTFVDKVFALCDYYLSGAILRQSRHIYDLYKLLPHIQAEGLEQLVHQVRGDRRANKTCMSAQPGQDVPALLREIVQTEYYRSDYEKITTALFFADENVAYTEAIKTLSVIAEEPWFIAPQ